MEMLNGRSCEVLQPSADEFQQSIEFQDTDRNAKVKDIAGSDAAQPDGVLFGGDLNLAGQRLQVSIRIAVVIGESNTSCQRNPQVFKCVEKPVGFGDAGKRCNCAILNGFYRDRLATSIYAVRNSADNEGRDGKFRQRRRMLLHDRRVGALDRFLGFSPASIREKAFPGKPLHRINRYKVDVAEEPAVLKAIIENEDVSKTPLFGEQTGSVTIGSDNDGRTGSTAGNQERFIPCFFPWNRRPTSAADDHDPGTLALVSTRQNDGTEALFEQLLGKQDYERRLACAANGDVSDTDDWMVEAISLKDAARV